MSWTLYRHRKGMLYLGIGHALHSEDRSAMTLYRCLYDNELGKTWARPRPMFEDSTHGGERRFTPIARMRVVQPEDEPIVLMFGHDAWGKGRPPGEFIADYQTHNKNHLRGTRYLLETLEGVILCNLNTIRFARGIIGIASVATAPAHRRKGCAPQLLTAVMELLRFQNEGEVRELRFLLFSEVPPRIYEPCGFRVLPPVHQHWEPSIAMATGNLPLSPQEAEILKTYF
jgi:GNAT superfamily N-acetyltransferase